MGEPTAEELELLTDEEREALSFDEDATDGEDEVLESNPKPDPEPEPAPEAKEDPQPEPPAEELPKEEAAPVTPEPEAIEVNFVPKPVTTLPADIKQQVDAEAQKVNAGLAKKLSDLKDQYDEGAFETSDYIEQADQIRTQMNDNRTDVREAIRSEWQERTTAAQRWDAEQDAFFTSFPEFDAPKYDAAGAITAGNPIMYGALDAACRKVAQENKGVTGINLLMQAKAEVEKAMGIAPSKKSGRPSAPLPGKTLGDLPSAMAESTGSNEFSALDNLGGDALEDALGKMSAAQRERYLAG